MPLASFHFGVALGSLLFAVAFVLAVEWVYTRYLRWQFGRVSTQLQNRLARPEKDPSEPSQSTPESRILLRLTEAEAICERPDGKTERVRWEALQSVFLVTTDDGPFAPDVFWLLMDADGGCLVPQGATGEEALLQRLQALQGFDNEAVIEAMGCTSQNRFLCWQRVALVVS